MKFSIILYFCLIQSLAFGRDFVSQSLGRVDTHPSLAADVHWQQSPDPIPLTESQKKFEASVHNSYKKLGLQKRTFKGGDQIGIVGAGIAGLSIARSLIRKGVPGASITIFDERNLPGGKTRGLFIKDSTGKPRHYELGAAVIIPDRYKLIEDLILKHNLGTRPLDAPTFFNVKEGSILAEPTVEEKLKLRDQAGYYLGLFRNNPSWMSLMSPDGYRNVPEELEKSWTEFLLKHGENFDLLNKRLAVAIGGSGFLMSQNPPFAAQVLRFVNPAFLMPILTPGKGSRMFNELDGPCLGDDSSMGLTEINGFQCLWIREADELARIYGVNFKLGTRVSKIERGDKIKLSLSKQVKTKDDADEQIGYSGVSFRKQPPLFFDHVFYTGDLRYLTSSPWREGRSKFQGILAKATKQEVALFNSINIYPYKSYLVKLGNFPVEGKEGFFALTPQINTGDKNRAVLMMRTYKDTDVYQVWGYGNRSNESTEEFLLNFQRDMQRLKVDFNRERDVLVKSEWDYFPHATPQSGKSLKDFFNSIMARQGVGGLWYSSEVMGFGLTIEAYEQGKAFAEWFVDGKL